MPARSNIRKRKAPRRKMRRARVTRQPTNVPEWASLSETKEFDPLLIGSPYNINNTKLIDFPRASAVAQGYQYFRILKLKFTISPLLDTFTSGGTTQVPYLTWVINKTGNAFVGLTKAWFLQNGAKPIRFDDKNITISYAPAILTDVTESAAAGFVNQPNLPKVRQWLTTNSEAFGTIFNPSTVSHTGHYMLVSSEGSTTPMNYRMTMTAEFQFKKPLSALPLSTDHGYQLVQQL